MKRESHNANHFTCIHASPKSLLQMKNGALEMFQNLTNFTQLTNQDSPPTPTSPRGFLGSSAGKESSCKAGDPSSIPRLGSFPGEGMGYPRQYS